MISEKIKSRSAATSSVSLDDREHGGDLECLGNVCFISQCAWQAELSSEGKDIPTSTRFLENNFCSPEGCPPAVPASSTHNRPLFISSQIHSFQASLNLLFHSDTHNFLIYPLSSVEEGQGSHISPNSER